jgi:hypothetical protein
LPFFCRDYLKKGRKSVSHVTGGGHSNLALKTNMPYLTTSM